MTSELTTACPACEESIEGGFCVQCGLRSEQDAPRAPSVQRSRLKVAELGEFNLSNMSTDASGCQYATAENADGSTYFSVLYPSDEAHEAVKSMGDRLGGRVIESLTIEVEGSGCYDFFDLSGWSQLEALLGEVADEIDERGPLTLMRTIGLPLCALVAGLHRDQILLGSPAPDWFAFDGEGACRLTPKARPRQWGGSPEKRSVNAVTKGYSCPEAYGRCSGELGMPSDVYFVGVVLYSLLGRIVPMGGTAHHVQRAPALRAHADDIPPLLGAVALRACSPFPQRRYANGQALLDAFGVALDVEEKRSKFGTRTMAIDQGSEVHIGLVKALYAPVNQDEIFIGYDGLSTTGLFVVSDGVSISHYGSGDVASGCVRQAASILWNRLSGRGSIGNPDDTLTVESPASQSGILDRVPSNSAERRILIGDMLDHANVRIGQIVAPILPTTPQPMESIMAATAVVLLLDRNQATFGYIGDSRVYLVREGHIAQLSVDHNLKTQLIRNGRPPVMANQVQGANALVRCVGDFDRGPDGSLAAVPLQPEFVDLTVLPGDRIVLCSDGVVDYMDFDEEGAEAKICALVEEAPSAAWAAFELMVAANRGGGGDNISCIVLNFDQLSPDGGAYR